MKKNNFVLLEKAITSYAAKLKDLTWDEYTKTSLMNVYLSYKISVG